MPSVHTFAFFTQNPFLMFVAVGGCHGDHSVLCKYMYYSRIVLRCTTNKQNLLYY